MTNEHLTVILGLGATVAWGSGDFCGGLASRRHNVYNVLLVAQLVSVFPLLALTLSLENQLPKLYDVLLGGIGGIFSILGVLYLYIGLAQGRMSVVAPLTAILSSTISVAVGVVMDGMPTRIQGIGFACALLAIGFLSSDGKRFTASPIELRLSMLSGIGFAVFYISLNSVSGETLLWPIFTARISSLIVLSCYFFKHSNWHAPSIKLFPLVALTGLLDTLGNYFFTMATQTGRLDVATTVSSLYPVITVLLALILLKERQKTSQWIGMLITFLAVFCITVK